MRRIFSLTTLATLLCSSPLLASRPLAPPPTDDAPGFDALAAEAPLSPDRFTAQAKVSVPGLEQRAVLHVDTRHGVPTFFWAGGTMGPSARRALSQNLGAAEVARGHLADQGVLYHLDSEDVRAAVVRHVHDTGRGPVIVQFSQSVAGVPVFRDEAHIAMNRDLGLLSISGYLTGAEVTTIEGGRVSFPRGATEAIASALNDLSGASTVSGQFVHERDAEAGYQFFRFASTSPDVVVPEPARARKVLFHLPGSLEPSWYVEIAAQRPGSRDSELFSYVISALDGRVLFRNDLTAYDYTYKVWAETSGTRLPADGPAGHTGPHPTGTPNGYQAPLVAPSVVTLGSSPFTKNDPWLPAGTHALIGNNTEAYADIVAPDGYTEGDVHGEAGTSGAFDAPFDFAKAPDADQNQRQAVMAQLFYDVNFFHDWYYDNGFTEAAGNGQTDNFGRGGVAGDSIKAEAQDNSGRNNANMSTPADGGRPRMQMYIFDGNAPDPILKVNTPAGITMTDFIGTAAFGAQEFNVTGNLAVTVPDDGCGPLSNGSAVAGKIAIINRGTCAFVDKLTNANAAGALAMIIVNNVEGGISMAGTLDVPIGALAVTQADGAKLFGALASGAVNVMMKKQFVQARDGALDNQIVAHEWGHYISNRLIHDSNGLDTSMARGMGEGWADTHAMLMTVRASDTAVSGNSHFGGVYAVATFTSSGAANDGYYYGIRRIPYSTDMSKNAFTFKHISAAEALPTTAPINPEYGTNPSNNPEVHNVGEIWATMLWECYAGLLNDSRFTFDQARTRMKDILVAAYKLTPASPTLLEARDALLTAAYGFSPLDYKVILTAFAKRGAGTRAIAPDRHSPSNEGVVESYLAGQDVAITSATLDNSTTARCGAKQTLLSGESGKLTLKLKNTGLDVVAAATATLFTANTSVTLPSGGGIAIGALNPMQEVTVTANVALAANATGVQTIDFTLTYPGAANIAPITTTLVANAVSFPAQTATDTMESPDTTWLAAQDAVTYFEGPIWNRYAFGVTDHRWWGGELGYPTDMTLTSPKVAVNATGDFVINLKHRHNFNQITSVTPARFYSGGVVEIAVVNGDAMPPAAAWKDSATSAYNGQIYVDPSNPGIVYAHNPLEDRKAFTGKSASYPALTTASINLGTTYAGKAVRVRFHIGTGYYGIGTQGWEIDDIAFVNIANKPFAALVPAGTACPVQPTAVVGANQTVNEGATVTLDGHASTDPGSATLTYNWAQTGGPTATLSSATAASPTFTAPAVKGNQTLTFELTVNNGTLTSSPAATQVAVTDTNHAPVAATGATIEAKTGETVTLDGSGSTDADSDPLTYTWTQVSGATVTLSDAKAVKPTFAAGAEGALVFKLSVNDGTVESAVSTFTVNVGGGGCHSFPGGAGALQLLPLGLVMLWSRRRRSAAP